MVVKVEKCVGCHMTEMEGAEGGRERKLEGSIERDREMEMERITIGKKKLDGITHIVGAKVILH